MPENSLVMMYLVFFVSLISLAVLIWNPGQISPRFSTQENEVSFIVNEVHKISETDMVATVTNLRNAVEVEAFATLPDGRVVKAPSTYTLGSEQASTLTLRFSESTRDATEVTLRALGGKADLWKF